MGLILFLGAGVGFVAAIAATFLLARRLAGAPRAGAAGGAALQHGALRGAAAGGLIGLAPALLLGIVVGGTLGGAYGAELAEGSGARDSGALFGFTLGVFAVATILLAASTWAGARVGRWLASRELP